MGTLTVAGQTYTVSQDAPAPTPTPACTGTLATSASTVVAAGGSGAVDVTAAANCTWTAASNAAWLLVTTGATGTGIGTVSYNAAPNSGAERTGTLTIAGRTFTVTQQAAAPTAACTVSLDKTSLLVGAAEANWIINVTTPDSTCAWTPSADAAWLVVKSTLPTLAPVTGPGSVKVRAVANTGPRRVGHFIVNGVVYTVTQGAGGL
jgi:hypothetical protein